MQYVVRIAIGAALGLVAAFALAFFVASWWVAALVGALLAAIGFLGSFFIWSADRLDEGYEQVLFDMPNNVVTFVLIATISGIAFGASWALGPGAEDEAGPILPPEEAAAVASMTTSQAKLQAILVDYPAAKEDVSKLRAMIEQSTAAKAEVDALDVPGRLEPMLLALKEEASVLVGALEAQDSCVAGDTAACVDARVGFAEAQRAEKDYFDEAESLGAL